MAQTYDVLSYAQGLGVPFNIASYALLTYMIAHVCKLKVSKQLFYTRQPLFYFIFNKLQPGDFVHTLGDAHVYLNHIEPLQEQVSYGIDNHRLYINYFLVQLKRKPRPFPTLDIIREVTDIDDFKFEDFVIKGYKPHPKIQMEMAV